MFVYLIPFPQGLIIMVMVFCCLYKGRFVEECNATQNMRINSQVTSNLKIFTLEMYTNWFVSNIEVIIQGSIILSPSNMLKVDNI